MIYKEFQCIKSTKLNKLIVHRALDRIGLTKIWYVANFLNLFEIKINDNQFSQ